MLDVASTTVSITCSTPRETFAPEELEGLAQAILATGGLIQPIVVLELKKYFKYELISGAKEYWASVRASELDPTKGEMANAMILQPEQVAPAKAQRAFLAPTPELTPLQAFKLKQEQELLEFMKNQ